MKNIDNSSNSNLILHLIKSCENYDLTEKESLEVITKVLGKDISRGTYYNYKKKLYDKEIFHTLKNSIYDSHMMRCLLLELEDDNRVQSLKADMLVWEQLPERKDIFHDITNLQTEHNKAIEKMDQAYDKIQEKIENPKQKYQSIPKNANIREEFIKCGRETCNDCPHGPYYYAYWKDKTNKKIKKKYLGVIDPRHGTIFNSQRLELVQLN